MIRARKRNAHFAAAVDVTPGVRAEVRMIIDHGKPPWVTFRAKGRQAHFAMPLADLIALGFRKAQVRFAEHELGTGRDLTPKLCPKCLRYPHPGRECVRVEGPIA